MPAVSLRLLLCCSVLGAWALPPAALAAERPVVAVFTLKSDGARIKTDELERLSDYIGAALTESGRYQVVPKSEMKAALNAKKKASYKQCYAESCQIEVGKELAADKALAGAVARIGSWCTVTLKIVDLRKATEETAARTKGKCGSDNVLESLDKALAKLTRTAVRSGGGRAPGPAVLQGQDYGDLDAEIAAETRKTAAVKTAKRARERAAKQDWVKIQRYVISDELGVQSRVQILEKFLRTFPTDNPHFAHAQSVLHRLRTSGGMVRVPGGNFYMGCNETVDGECESDEKPGKKVHVASFRIDTTEVTVAAYKKCVDAGNCARAHGNFKRISDSSDCNWGHSGRDKHPMNCVNWAGADRYCKWAGKRLPSEREWEKAARGTDGRKYPWGNTKVSCTYAVLNDGGLGCGRKPTWPVGSKPAGKSPYGALDMVGNVSEWVAGWHTEGRYRYMRGGSWADNPRKARASIRNHVRPTIRFSDMGFRCALSE